MEKHKVGHISETVRFVNSLQKKEFEKNPTMKPLLSPPNAHTLWPAPIEDRKSIPKRKQKRKRWQKVETQPKPHLQTTQRMYSNTATPRWRSLCRVRPPSRNYLHCLRQPQHREFPTRVGCHRSVRTGHCWWHQSLDWSFGCGCRGAWARLNLMTVTVKSFGRLWSICMKRVFGENLIGGLNGASRVIFGSGAAGTLGSWQAHNEVCRSDEHPSKLI